MDDSTINQEREFVKRLISTDPKICEIAWKEFIGLSSKMFAHYRRFLKDFNFSIDDLVSETYLYLRENDDRRLRDFLVYGKSFIGYIYNVIKAVNKQLLYKDLKKDKLEVSDSDYEFPLIANEENFDFENDNTEDYRTILNKAFSLLWIGNSQQAYIYLMREKMELPSKTVANLLGLTVDNVDVILKRGKHEMKNILEALGLNEDFMQDKI